jgi:hypothetical protein
MNGTIGYLSRWRLGAVSVCLAAAFAVAAAAKGPATVSVVSFSIDGPSPPYAVTGDEFGSAYADYRIAATTSNTDPDYCVEASPESSGFLFVRLNRKLDGDSGSMYCGLFGGVGTTPRHYSLTINAQEICDELYTSGYTDATFPCTVNGRDKPRIRLSNLYASKPAKTPVAFLMETYDVNDVSYEIQTVNDADVSVAGGTTNIRVVQYGGQMRLVKFAPGARPTTILAPFLLPFHMTFNRQTR